VAIVASLYFSAQTASGVWRAQEIRTETWTRKPQRLMAFAGEAGPSERGIAVAGLRDSGHFEGAPKPHHSWWSNWANCRLTAMRRGHYSSPGRPVIHAGRSAVPAPPNPTEMPSGWLRLEIGRKRRNRTHDTNLPSWHRPNQQQP
jgi:hypothetical protein